MNRKSFLKSGLLGGAGLLLPGSSSANKNYKLSQNIPVFRFAVGGDLHYGIDEYQKHSENLVNWLNREKENRGLDLYFLNGDIVHDITDKYEELQSEFLSGLSMPYFATKGNHDYLEAGQTWESVWGYAANQIVEAGPLAFIFADTSRGNDLDASVYTSPDPQWMQNALQAVSDKTAVFIVLHIAQRREGGTGWPQPWPRFGVGHYEESRISEAERVLAMIESAPNVKAVFHGHNHNIISSYTTHSAPQPNAKPYFFCSRVGHSWGNTIGYRIVEIYENGSARTYQYDPESETALNTELIEMKAPDQPCRTTFDNKSFDIRLV
ncbi:MAG: hypothetical protein EA391_02735 [Balneolaceae bacterium]|nr:MAG: hypothetical protein EA391_02735 [Balneolaceae bacterium]